MGVVCRVIGHRWLMEGFPCRLYVCMGDTCLRCSATRTFHATTHDELTDRGGGGCAHGTPGRITLDV